MDSETRTWLIQERKVRSFSEIVSTATAIELSKKESVMISEPFLRQEANEITTGMSKQDQQTQRTKMQNNQNKERRVRVIV